jgi:ER degradation enhancer, mannosidase alpha-like 1
MRSPLNLVGTTLDVLTGKWIEYSSGIGAGNTILFNVCLSALCEGYFFVPALTVT